MKIINRHSCSGALIGLVLATGCSDAPALVEPAPTLEQLVIEDPTFGFETTQPVRLRIETPTDVTTAVEVTDEEGRRLFKGGVRSNVDIDLGLPRLSRPTLNVRVGVGDEAETQTVTVQDGLAVTRL